MNLYLHDVAPHRAPTIVWLHGGGLSGRMWKPQIEAFKDYNLIVPDLPEQGRNRAQAPFALESTALAVAEAIHARAMGTRAHVVGLSLGGAVALTLMRLAPEVVDHVVVSGTAAGLGKLVGNIGLASAGLSSLFSRDRLIQSSIKQLNVPAEYQAMFREDLEVGAPFARTVYRELMGMQLPRNSEARTLIAVGSNETGPARSAARSLQEQLQNCRRVTAPNVGHLWNLEAPDLFNRMVRAWINDRPLPDELVFEHQYSAAG